MTAPFGRGSARNETIPSRDRRERFISFRFILFVVVLVCAAQQVSDTKKTDTPEIRGTVVEYGTSHGIYDVEVTLERLPDGAPRLISVTTPWEFVGRTRTDTSGAFAFALEKFGDYRIQVFPEGYDPTGPSNAMRTLDSAHPRREVKFVLARPGEITGRVVDEETREPIAGMRVVVLQSEYRRGQRRTTPPGGSAITDNDGRFLVPKLPPGEYIANTAPRISGKEVLLTEFSEEDLKKVDQDYAVTYWPGGGDLSTAFAVPLGSGGSVDMGQLTVRKAPVYRARVSLLCAPTATAQLNVRLSAGGVSTIGTVPCAKDFMLRGFTSGSYRLEVVVEGGDRSTRERGSIPFEVVDKNIDVLVPVARGVDIDGRIVLAEGASKPEFRALKVFLLPIGGTTIFGEEQNPIDAQGKFVIVNTAIRDQRLMVSGLAKPHYVKEVRYNGHRVADDILPMDSQAIGHSLEVLVDDKPAMVMGAVTDQDKPVSEAHVVLVRWPPNALDLFNSVSTATGDEIGKFTFSGLAPGDYRILAVSSEARGKLEEPGVLERLLGAAERLSLNERAVRQLELKLVSP